MEEEGERAAVAPEAAADDRDGLAAKGDAAAQLARERFDRDTLGRDFVAWVTGGEPPAGRVQEGPDA